MRNINLFVEDAAHEDFLNALVQRLANDYNIKVSIKAYSVRRGHGMVVRELKQYLQDLHRNKDNLPDLVIVGTDSNCTRILEREKEINQITSDLTDIVVSMIPDPHIERWLLLDSEAFKTVFGKGRPTPDQKCERGRYKHMLLNAIYDATRVPPLDGMERMEELVKSMDLRHMEQNDRSVQRFLSALRRQFKTWQQTEN